jgi:hypothetical protein
MHRASFHEFSTTISFCSCCLQRSTYTVELHIWDCIWESVEVKAIRGDGWTLKHQDLEEGKLFLLSMFLLCILCWSFALMLWTCVLCAFEWFWFVFVSCALELMFCFRLCCVPFVLQAFGLCFEHLCFVHFVLWTFEKETLGCELLVCALSIWDLNILCYELPKKRFYD